jgi:hypothetical protein
MSIRRDNSALDDTAERFEKGHFMGITLAYRARLADLTRIEEFEDRLLDFSLEVGGQAQIWRSYSNDDPKRVVRGAILSLAPGQESVSLLVAPEGWLIGLTDIKDAERGRLTEPPWCFTKTQFGPVEGHVMLVEIFTALRRELIRAADAFSRRRRHNGRPGPGATRPRR